MIPAHSLSGLHSDATLSLGDLLRLRDTVASTASIRELGITFEVQDGRAVAYQHSMRVVALDSISVSQSMLVVALNREVKRRSRAFEDQLRAGDAATFQRLEELATWAPPGYNPKSTCLHLMALADNAGLRACVLHDAGASRSGEDAERECFVVRYAEADGTETPLTTVVWMTGKAVTVVGDARLSHGFATVWPESQSRDFAAAMAAWRRAAAAGADDDKRDQRIPRSAKG